MKARWLTCLLCCLILAACLDNIPDPPAVNPHASDIGAAFSLDFHGHAHPAIGKQQPYFLKVAACYATPWFYGNPFVENSSPSCPQTPICESTDSSPPAARNAALVLFA
jgi:hypothetical protein